MQVWCRVLCVAWLAVGLTRAAGGQDGPPNGQKLYYPECQRFARSLTFDCYHSYPEVARFLEDAASQFPQYARLESIGKSYQGRDLWVLTVTDFNAGSPEHKPAMWVDGGIDADEVIATEAALGLVHRLLTSEDPSMHALLRTRVFYIAPAVIPDASELHHTTPERPRDTTLRPWDDDGDGATDEDGVEDLDGDRQALQMRVRDPAGSMTVDERDLRLMRRRRPGDAGPFYRVYTEGMDNDGDGEYNEDRLGGIDPNRNYPGNWSIEQGGSGPFAGSELELRAMLDFIIAHPNIAASQHFHSSGGVVLRPPSVPNMTLPEPDLQLYLAMSRRGLEVTGYSLATSVYDWNWPRGSRNRKPSQVYRDQEGEIRGMPDGDDANAGAAYPAFGGSIDALYQLFGVLAFANEIYQMGDDTDGDGRVDGVEQLSYDDNEMGGAVFKEWAEFEHPQLGTVEIGGWRKFGQNNPIGDRLAEEVRRNVDFAIMQAEHMPLLVVSDAKSEALGGGVYRVTATVRNEGYQPTELAVLRQNDRAVPVRARLEAGDGIELLSASGKMDIGTIAGYGEEDVEWLVRAPNGGAVTVVTWHRKAGKATATVNTRR
jgi:hypothetical protein